MKTTREYLEEIAKEGKFLGLISRNQDGLLEILKSSENQYPLYLSNELHDWVQEIITQYLRDKLKAGPMQHLPPPR